MTSLSKRGRVSIIISPYKDVGLEMQPRASLACSLSSQVCYITHKPWRNGSCSEGLNKICDDAFLAGHFCALKQTAQAVKSTVISNMWPENRWILRPSKKISSTLVKWTFVSAWICFRNVLPKIAYVVTCGQGQDFSTAYNKTLNICFTNCGSTHL